MCEDIGAFLYYMICFMGINNHARCERCSIFSWVRSIFPLLSVPNKGSAFSEQVLGVPAVLLKLGRSLVYRRVCVCEQSCEDLYFVAHVLCCM